MALGISSLNATMRGVVYDAVPFHVTVQNLPMPKIINQTDAIVRITTSAICGSDLHVYHGFMGGVPPWNMGHEAIGYVTEIGTAVSSFGLGDYVIIPDTTSSGNLQVEPASTEYFGFGGSEPWAKGLQSEYARVRFADANLIPIPLTYNTTNSTIERDFLTVSDIFATGWTSLDFAGFQTGDSVAVFGAGPVGLLAAYSALLRGASRVYVVDHIAERLARAASIGAIPIDFTEEDPVMQILAFESNGVMRSVDCVGMEAINSRRQPQADIVIHQMINATHFGGGIGQVGVFKDQKGSPGAPLAWNISSEISFPIAQFFSKSLSFKSGAVDPKIVAGKLIELIASGKAHPSFIVSSIIGIEDAPEYYGRFSRQEEIKIVIQFL